MKSKKLLSLFLVAVMMFTMAFANVTTTFAETGNKKVTTSGKMTVILNTNQTGNSSEATFTVSGLPANAKVTKIEINTGSMTYNGAMLTNYLMLTSSNKSTAEKIAWSGAANTNLSSSGFLMTAANGTYKIYFNCTCLGGAIVSGTVTNIGTKEYKNMTLTVYWDDSL